MKFEGLYDIRPPVPEDINFILATWLRGLYYGDSWFTLIPKNIFMNQYKKIINSLLINGNYIVRVACLKEDSNTILGYSVVSTNNQAVAWVFVKTPWRRQGIGRSLLPSEPTYATHLTAMGKELLPKFNLSFNPFYGA